MFTPKKRRKKFTVSRLREIFPGSATIQSLPGLVFPAGRATMIDGFEHV